MNYTATMRVHQLMERTGMTYDEAYEELAYQADCEHDRRRDNELTEQLERDEK